MASLSFIMDVNDDHQTDGRPPLNKRDRGAHKPASAGPPHEPPSNSRPDASHASSPDLATTEKDIKQTLPAGQTGRPGASSQSPKPLVPQTSSGADARAGAGVAVAASPSASTSPSLSASTARQSTRRRSSTSTDSMDRSRYGLAPSSSSMDGGLQRPMPLHSASSQFTPKITPKTGRVSKAKKGLPVHVCDICRPPKTFTRAEHLRRHQLGHGAPQFQCTGCDRSFHRADLLTRHQQKHEHNGDDDVSRLGSAQQSPHPSPAALSFQARHPPGTPGQASAASPSATEIPPQPPNTGGNQPGFSRIGSPSNASNSVYGTTSRAPSQDFHSPYTPTLSIVNPTQSPSLAGSYQSNLGEYQPRTGQPSIFVVTQLPSVQHSAELPELYDASPNPSSASDSTFSTPVSDVSRIPRPWVRGHRSPTADWASSQRLSPYPGTAPRGLQSSGPGIEGIPALQSPLFISPYPNAQPSDHTFGATLNVPPSMGYSTTGTGHHHPSLSASSHSTVRPRQHQQASSFSAVGSRTPPLSSSSQGSETLLASAPSFSSHLDSMAGLDRRKGRMVGAHQELLGSQGTMGSLDVLGGLATAYGGSNSAASPHADNVSHSSGMVTELELDLALRGDCAMSIPSMTIPLPGPVRSAIPRYLEIYWAQVDPVLPLIHRQSHDGGLEDVLKCAMAAVATQHLDSREDRTRGNQLHEFAWQEVKRVPQWSLQTMQAILLCEYFARFRGRKAVTRPSKPFESLYSRVLYQNSALLDQAMLAVDQHHLSIQDRWQNWIEIESRRRLLAACFFGDSHAAIYQQQRRVQDTDAGASAELQMIPLLGRSTKLWEASSAEEWVKVLAADPGALQTDHVPTLEHLTREDVLRYPPIDRMLVLGVLAQRLPRPQRLPPGASLSANNSPPPEMDSHMQHVGSQFNQQPPLYHHHSHQSSPQLHPSHYTFNAEERINTLFPDCPIANTYLALHHTPLRDLLAVGGDSWLFSQKVLPATTFHEHQKRLKMWVTAAPGTTTGSGNNPSGLSVAHATIYAARAILGFLDRETHRPPQPSSSSSSSSSSYPLRHGAAAAAAAAPSAAWSADMSDYWAMYVCALICWAFCHPARGADGLAPPVSSSGGGNGNGGSGGSSPAAVLMPPMATSSRPAGANALVTPTAASDEEEAVGWLRMVAVEGVRVEDVVRVRGLREAGGVVGLVRRRLESDCVGGRSRLYVDAVGVLRKVEDGVGWKWF